VDQANPAAYPAQRAGKLDRVRAHIVCRRLQAPRTFGRDDNRLQIVQRARKTRRQAVRQKAERRMALRAIPARNLRPGRALPPVSAVVCHGTSALRVIRAALKPCIAPRFGLNVFLAGKPRLVTKLQSGHGPAGVPTAGPLLVVPPRKLQNQPGGAKPQDRHVPRSATFPGNPPGAQCGKKSLGSYRAKGTQHSVARWCSDFMTATIHLGLTEARGRSCGGGYLEPVCFNRMHAPKMFHESASLDTKIERGKAT